MVHINYELELGVGEVADEFVTTTTLKWVGKWRDWERDGRAGLRI